MILVRRNAALIPEKLLKMAQRAQEKLETLPQEERAGFIRKKARIWRLFAKYLSQMSYNKCWYSESPDPQSFFDVDHFRPKLEAKRSDHEVDRPGYEWLAFSWENFRYSANCSNRLRENIETGAVDGKGSWFPLVDGSPKADWSNRCECHERPVLLDPVVQQDIDLIDVSAEGRIIPGKTAVGSAIRRVERSCELYGLNLPAIKAARARLIRDIIGHVEALNQDLDAARLPETPAPVADRMSFPQRTDFLRQLTFPDRPYSRTARATLIDQGWAHLCVSPESFNSPQAA